jgi:signal transduction histidine kinase
MLKYLGGSDEKPGSDQDAESTHTEVDDPTVDEFAEESEEQGPEPELSEDAEVVPELEEDRQVALFKQRNEQLEQRIGYLERIVKISQILNSNLSIEPLLQIIIQSATELTDTEACSIMLIDKNTGELRFSEATGGLNDTLKKVTVPLNNSIGGWVIRHNRPLLIRNAKNDPRWHGDVDESGNFETRSILGVPLQVRDEVIGVLEVINKKKEEGFNEDDIQIATTLSAHAATAIENARLLDELQQAYRTLAEVDRLKGDFISIASHELRTPLAVILGYATFLRDNVSGQAGEQLDIVLNSAIRLRGLIDDMVNLRHIQADEVQLERTIFSFQQLVVDVAKEFSQIVAGKQQILTTKFSPDNNPLNIDADRQKVYLILANLISNAVKFTDEGGRIHINVELKDHKYWVDVIDTGIGIPKQKYNQIFDQFYQVEPSLTRKYQGMGIGLSIAKGMVEVHKGRIWVESVVGKGCKFSFILPTAPDVA